MGLSVLYCGDIFILFSSLLFFCFPFCFLFIQWIKEEVTIHLYPLLLLDLFLLQFLANLNLTPGLLCAQYSAPLAADDKSRMLPRAATSEIWNTSRAATRIGLFESVWRIPIVHSDKNTFDNAVSADCKSSSSEVCNLHYSAARGRWVLGAGTWQNTDVLELQLCFPSVHRPYT